MSWAQWTHRLGETHLSRGIPSKSGRDTKDRVFLVRQRGGGGGDSCGCLTRCRCGTLLINHEEDHFKRLLQPLEREPTKRMRLLVKLCSKSGLRCNASRTVKHTASHAHGIGDVVEKELIGCGGTLQRNILRLTLVCRRRGRVSNGECHQGHVQAAQLGKG